MNAEAQKSNVFKKFLESQLCLTIIDQLTALGKKELEYSFFMVKILENQKIAVYFKKEVADDISLDGATLLIISTFIEKDIIGDGTENGEDVSKKIIRDIVLRTEKHKGNDLSKERIDQLTVKALSVIMKLYPPQKK